MDFEFLFGNAVLNLPGACVPFLASASAEQLRVLIALASNDARSANLGNIGTLLNRKNVYFVPMKQDDPSAKPHSLVADFSKIRGCLTAMTEGRQCRPLFL